MMLVKIYSTVNHVVYITVGGGHSLKLCKYNFWRSPGKLSVWSLNLSWPCLYEPCCTIVILSPCSKNIIVLKFSRTTVAAKKAAVIDSDSDFGSNANTINSSKEDKDDEWLRITGQLPEKSSQSTKTSKLFINPLPQSQFFLNWIIHLTFLELFFMNLWKWSAPKWVFLYSTKFMVEWYVTGFQVSDLFFCCKKVWD